MIHGRARARRGIVVVALALLALAHPARVHSQDAEPDSAAIPEAHGYVNDLAGVMDEPSRAQLEAFLDQVEKKTGAEFAVLTVKTTAPLAPSEYKTLVFQRWGLGKRGENNGLLMLVAIAETEVRFETGYGLEGVLPDGLQSRIYREVMRPHFRAGNVGRGITEGVLASSARIAREKGVTLEWNGRELRYTGRRNRRLPAEALVLVFIVVIMVFAVVANLLRGSGPRGGRRGRSDDWWIGPGGMGGLGGWGGGFGGRGGGFGGGGGGSTFGGFGGGLSGGGGGGGGGSGGW